MIDLELPQAVVNVLIDYVLKKSNNKLVPDYVELVASQWKRAGLKTAKDAMEFAEKEYKKTLSKNNDSNKKEVREIPVWFNKKITDDNLSSEEEEELKILLKEFK